MEQVEKYNIDYGEANIQDENADTVRIMSIHKSKGLEFPVCFVAGLSKKFNMQDTSKPVIMDMDYGIALDFVDIESRVKGNTLKKSVLSGKLRRDSLGEELRVLYVAMTRPQEKLILTGSCKEEEKVRRILENGEDYERAGGASGLYPPFRSRFVSGLASAGLGCLRAGGDTAVRIRPFTGKYGRRAGTGISETTAADI